jgi:hypothetical protein
LASAIVPPFGALSGLEATGKLLIMKANTSIVKNTVTNTTKRSLNNLIMSHLTPLQKDVQFLHTPKLEEELIS